MKASQTAKQSLKKEVEHDKHESLNQSKFNLNEKIKGNKNINEAKLKTVKKTNEIVENGNKENDDKKAFLKDIKTSESIEEKQSQTEIEKKNIAEQQHLVIKEKVNQEKNSDQSKKRKTEKSEFTKLDVSSN